MRDRNGRKLLAGMSGRAKLAVAAGIGIVAAGGIGVAVLAAYAGFCMGPAEGKIEGFTRLENGMSAAVGTSFPGYAARDIKTRLKSADGFLRGTEAKTAAGYNNEKNHRALAAYRAALKQDASLKSPTGRREFQVVDINTDGVYEVFLYVEGENSATTVSYLLYYSERLHIENLGLPDWAVIPDQSQFIAMRYQMGMWGNQYDGESVKLIKEFGYPDETQIPNTPDYDQRLREAEELLDSSLQYQTVSVTEQNLEKYLSGDGVPSQVWNPAMETPVEQETAEKAQPAQEEAFSVDMKSDIQFIRDTYAYTNGHIADYEKRAIDETGNYSYRENQTADTQESFYFDKEVLVKAVYEPDGLTIEAYHLNPALGRIEAPEYSPYPENTLVFAYAWDRSGAEYRIYFKEARVIRYIGADGKTVDYPQGCTWDEFHSDIMDTANRAFVDVLYYIAPRWWTAYEGE